MFKYSIESLDPKSEIIVTKVKQLFKKIRYGLRDPKTNRPWRDTHKSTTEQDYFDNWKLATGEQTIKCGYGICYDLVQLSIEQLKDSNIQYNVYFAYCAGTTPGSDNPTHTFLIWKDGEGYWRWLEGAWKPFISNKFSSKNEKELVSWIGTALANASEHDQTINNVKSCWPKIGSTMIEFETQCYHKGKPFCTIEYKGK